MIINVYTALIGYFFIYKLFYRVVMRMSLSLRKYTYRMS